MKERNFISRVGSLLGIKSGESSEPQKSTNELSKEAYLETLTKIDRKHVEGFTKWVEELSRSLNQGDAIALHAVGSSVRPIEKRYAPVHDIDLRILNSGEGQTEERKKLVTFIVDSVKNHLTLAGFQFENDEYTCTTKWVKGSTTNPVTGSQKEEMMPYIDWYNTDPSFNVVFKDGGKPLHVSISGLNNPDLDNYLKGEAKHNGYFSSLFNSKNTPVREA